MAETKDEEAWIVNQTHQQATGPEIRLDTRQESPAPSDRISTLQAEEDNEERRKRAASPRLPRKTLEELHSVDQKRQERGWDTDDPPLSTPWTFWFQR